MQRCDSLASRIEPLNPDVCEYGTFVLRVGFVFDVEIVGAAAGVGDSKAPVADAAVVGGYGAAGEHVPVHLGEADSGR